MSLGHRPWALVLRLVQAVGPDQDYTQGPLDVPESDPHSFLAKLGTRTEVCLLFNTKKAATHAWQDEELKLVRSCTLRAAHRRSASRCHCSMRCLM